MLSQSTSFTYYLKTLESDVMLLLKACSFYKSVSARLCVMTANCEQPLSWTTVHMAKHLYVSLNIWERKRRNSNENFQVQKYTIIIRENSGYSSKLINLKSICLASILLILLLMTTPNKPSHELLIHLSILHGKNFHSYVCQMVNTPNHWPYLLPFHYGFVH